jgi:hypothetical protein
LDFPTRYFLLVYVLKFDSVEFFAYLPQIKIR